MSRIVRSGNVPVSWRTELTKPCSGLQPRAVQGMLDFDFICKRKTPSVAGIIYTFGGQFVSKM